MDPNNIHEHQSIDEIEPTDLFEDSWFFSNLLHGKPRMLRSFSDPCSSSNSYDETYESIKKLPQSEGLMSSNLVKAPSMPPSVQRQNAAKGRSKSSNRRKALERLDRAPSLPISLGSDDDEDEDEDEEEIEFSMGKLIRQASLKISDQNLPPRIKVLTPSPSISRSSKSRRKPEVESVKADTLEEKTPQIPKNQLKTQKSLNALQSEQVQSLNDFKIDFANKVLNQNATPAQRIEGNATWTPHMTDMWRATSSAPPVPRWGGKKSRDDMKAQIKFWARAVASNVRQEC